MSWQKLRKGLKNEVHHYNNVKGKGVRRSAVFERRLRMEMGGRGS